ncbi:MAG: D-2-hydroxyacid dehydrogenase [Candidimonas sp.]
MTQTRCKIVFLDRDTISPSTRLNPFSFENELHIHGRTAPDQVAERIADADIVIVNKVRLDASALAGAPRLSLIAVAATGTDNVDLRYCAAQNITVCNIRGYAGTTVPEHTYALIFALRRSIVAYHNSVAAGRWQQSGQFCYFDHPIKDLKGSSLGIIGEGELGQAVAAIGRALGMKVSFAARKGVDRPGRLYTPFDTLIAQSDIITLHCPLTEQNRGLIGEREFALMKQKPLLINTARGGLVDEPALAKALRSGQLGGAGFDVASPEPPAADSILMQLLELPNFILTPHVAWASEQAIQELADQLIENIEAFHRGEPRRTVELPA